MTQLLDNRVSSHRASFVIEGAGGDLIVGLGHGVTIDTTTGAASIVDRQSVTLTASAANYVEIVPGDATATANTTGFTSGSLQLYIIDTSASDVLHIFDARQGQGLAGAGGGSGGAGVGTINTGVSGKLAYYPANGTTVDDLSFVSAAGTTLTVAGTVAATTLTGALTGNVTGNVSGSSGSTTGNAATATKLAATKTINGVAFDGSANITVTAAAGTLTGSALPALSGAALTALTAANIVGVIPIANLATGTPTGSKFIRDDGTLQAIAGGGDALVANPLSQFAATTSAQLAGVLSDETGTGALVFATNPTITINASCLTAGTIPDARFPATLPAASGANLTALGAAHITGVIPIANLATGTPNGSKFVRDDGTLAVPAGGGTGDALVANPLSQFAATTSAQLRGVLTDETGTGAAVFATSPTIASPTFTGTSSGLSASDLGAGTLATARLNNTVHAFGSTSGAKTFDYSTYEWATITLTGDVTMTLSNALATGSRSVFRLLEVGDGTHQTTYAGLTVTFPQGTPPVLGNGVKRYVEIVTTDAATALGFYSGDTAANPDWARLTGLLAPDVSGNVFWQPSSINGSNNKFPTDPVLVFKDTATKDGAMCHLTIPKNYVGTPKFRVRYRTTATAGNALFAVDYYVADVGDSTDPAAFTESLAGTAAAVPGTARLLGEQVLTATAANFAAGKELFVIVSRNGAGADTCAADIEIIDFVFEWAQS